MIPTDLHTYEFGPSRNSHKDQLTFIQGFLIRADMGLYAITAYIKDCQRFT